VGKLRVRCTLVLAEKKVFRALKPEKKSHCGPAKTGRITAELRLAPRQGKSQRVGKEKSSRAHEKGSCTGPKSAVLQKGFAMKGGRGVEQKASWKGLAMVRQGRQSQDWLGNKVLKDKGKTMEGIVPGKDLRFHAPGKGELARQGYCKGGIPYGRVRFARHQD